MPPNNCIIQCVPMTYWPTTISIITVTRNCLGKILCTYIKQLDLSLNRVVRTYVSRDKIKWFWNDNAIVNVKSRPTDISIVHIILLSSSLPTYQLHYCHVLPMYILATRVTNVAREIFCVCVCILCPLSNIWKRFFFLYIYIISIYTLQYHETPRDIERRRTVKIFTCLWT